MPEEPPGFPAGAGSPEPPGFGVLAPIVAAGTAVAATAGFFIGFAPLLPLLSCLPLWGAFPSLVRRGRRAGAWGLVCVWAASLSLTLTGLSVGDPERGAAVIANGTAYAAGMSAWVDTGGGDETHPAVFVPKQLLQAGLFALLALASGGLLSLPLGAYLIGFMSFHVATLMLRSHSPLLTLPVAWPPWSLARIAAFAALQSALAEPILRRGQGPPAGRVPAGLLLLAAAGILADLVMKTLLAGSWSGLIRATLG